jgi:hypothetical protein
MKSLGFSRVELGALFDEMTFLHDMHMQLMKKMIVKLPNIGLY